MSTEAAQGWFKATRNPEAMELIAANPRAFTLAYVIAYRAQWSDRFNRHALQPGEAFLGDHTSYGMTEREYRTAKSHLEKWGFATFRTTNKGTVAKLTDTRLFDVFLGRDDGQTDTRGTDDRQASDRQATTTEEEEEDKKNKKDGAPAPVVPGPLCVPEFLTAWDQWQAVRRKMKKAGDWNALFQSQLDWLASRDSKTATEIINTSIRNGWQGLFPLKANDTHRTNPNSPAAQRNAFIATTPAQEAATQARIRELQAASGQPGLAAQNAVF